MVRRTAKIIIQLLGGLGAGFAIVISLLAWQLSKGPISLGFLTEYLERAVNSDHPNFSLRLGDAIFTWAGWQRALDIRVLDVTVLSADGSGIGRVPEVWFSISGDALLHGKIAPRSIEFYGPRLSVRRESDGTIDVGFGRDGTKARAEMLALGFLDRLMAEPSLNQPMSYLSRVAIIGGAVAVRDEVLKRTWNLPVADIRLDKIDEGLRGEVNLVLDQGGRTTELVGDGTYRYADRRVSLDFNFSDVEPAVFSRLTRDLAPLEALNMPLSGTLGVVFPIDGGIEQISARINGKGGTLVLPVPYEQELAVVSTKLQAIFRAGSGIEVKNFDAVFAEGTKINLPDPIAHTEPLRRLSASGRFTNDRVLIELTNVVADLDGPVVNLSVALKSDGNVAGPKRYRILGKGNRIAMDELPRYWPKSVGRDPRQWVLKHFRGGHVEGLNFDMEIIAGTATEIGMVSIEGDMKVLGTVLDHLSPIPPIQDLSAQIRFDTKSLTVYSETGHSKGLELKSGRIVITGLDQVDQFADIDLKIKGSLRDKLAYIDHKMFRFASSLDLNLKQASGGADTRLKLFFMLEKELPLDRIKFWVRSSLSDVRIGNVFPGFNIDQGRLDLRIDGRGMDVKGDVKITNIPTKLVWRQNFTKKADFRSRFNFKAEIRDLRQLQDTGFHMDPFFWDSIRGGVESDITYTVFDGADRRLEMKADITNAAFLTSAFGWSKPIGKQGSAAVVVDLENSMVVDVPKFSLRAGDLNIQGKAKYALDGTGVEKVEFSSVAIGRTQMEGALIPKTDGGWEAGFHGRVLDLSLFWQDIMAEDNADEIDHPFLDRLTLAMEFDKVWLDGKRELYDVSGTFVRAENMWKTALINSRFGDGATFDLAIRPRADGNRYFSMHAENAGEVFKMLDIYSNMVGGKLRISGVYEDAKPGQPLRGSINVDDYRIINAPALAHIVSIMSLTGLLEALQGEGLAFINLDIPFELSHGIFSLKDAKATGASLGFTASGKVFRHADILDLEGTVIPAYAINSAFGHIPLFGDLFTGGEKGGGIFAVTYTMTGPVEEPVVSVNPLSALAPGFLRNVFGILSKSRSEKPFGGAPDLAPNPQ